MDLVIIDLHNVDSSAHARNRQWRLQVIVTMKILVHPSLNRNIASSRFLTINRMSIRIKELLQLLKLENIVCKSDKQ